MLDRMLVLALLAGCSLAVTPAHAGVAERRAHPRVVLEMEPAAPVADRPSLIVRNSLAAHPVEPIPVGEFGCFGTPADDTAPVAPASAPDWSVLDLKTDRDAQDAVAPVAPAP